MVNKEKPHHSFVYNLYSLSYIQTLLDLNNPLYNS
jgi:hypothetical protein